MCYPRVIAWLGHTAQSNAIPRLQCNTKECRFVFGVLFVFVLYFRQGKEEWAWNNSKLKGEKKRNETNEKKEKKLSCNYSDSYAGWISSFNQALDRSSSFLAWSAWTANKAAYPFTPRWWYKGHSFQMPYIVYNFIYKHNVFVYNLSH